MDSSRMDSDTVSMYDYQLILNQSIFILSNINFSLSERVWGAGRKQDENKFQVPVYPHRFLD